jgi:DNA-directed RNA polymerase specialized sigma subunit
VQRAIAQLKKILCQNVELEEPIANKETKKVSPPLTQTQVQVWQLRCKEQRSFAEIAERLGTSTQEVQQQFSLAYQYTQQHPQETLSLTR